MNKKLNNLKNTGNWIGVGTAIGTAIGTALAWKKPKK